MTTPEERWQNLIYTNAEFFFDRDPDKHHATISKQMTSAALNALVQIIDEEKPRDVVRFIRNLIV